MKRTVDSRELILGGEPRADLLPPELKARRAGRALHRAMGMGLVGLIVLMGITIGAVSLNAFVKHNELAAATLQTDNLLLDTSKYAEVRRVQNQYDTTLSVRALGLSTEVDWKVYLESIRSMLPADVTIDIVTVSSASPWTPFAQSEVPLTGPRTASLVLTVTSPSVPPVPDWLDDMKTLSGYSDATPGSITRDDNANYVVTIALNINEEALSNRFAVKE